MSEADRRRDPRAELEEDERPAAQVERPFERGSASVKLPAAELASTSEVRVVSRKDGRAEPPEGAVPRATPPPGELASLVEEGRPKLESAPDLIDFERPQSKSEVTITSASARPAASSEAATSSEGIRFGEIESLPPGLLTSMPPVPALPVRPAAPPPPGPSAAASPPHPSAGASLAPAHVEPAMAAGSLAPPSSGPDSLLSTVEHLVDHAKWETICEVLGPAERAAELPAALAAVYAIARMEAHPEDTGTVEQLIKTTARGYGLAETSPIARIIAKRIVRRSPTEWRKRPAPPKTISIIILFVALVLGGGGGFWLSNTKVTLPLPSFMHSK